MKKLSKIFLLGILAGLSIGLGSLLYTICSASSLKLLGSFVFGIGLLTVCLFSLYLYTGKVGFIVNSENKKKYIGELAIGLLGNLVGAVSFGYLMLILFKDNDSVMNAINSIATKRLVSINNEYTPFYKTLISSFFCGVLVYLAVYNFKQDYHILVKVIVLLFAVFAFVASGFEHCIANMYYISMANMWNLRTIVNVLVCIIGNSLGAILFSIITKKVSF